MSRALQYAAQCAECGRPMRAGALADFFEDGKGGYRYIHAGDCPVDKPPPPRIVSQPRAVARDTYTCPACLGDWCFDRGAFARGRGKGVPVCPGCQKPWPELYAAIQEGREVTATIHLPQLKAEAA